MSGYKVLKLPNLKIEKGQDNPLCVSCSCFGIRSQLYLRAMKMELRASILPLEPTPALDAQMSGHTVVFFSSTLI
jgi:hypothetical protein